MNYLKLWMPTYWQNLVARSALSFCLAAMLPSAVQAADSVVIVGKNDWLFAHHTTIFESLDRDAQVSFDLIERLNRMMTRNNITLAVTVVPSKIETYAEQLPDDYKISPYMSGFNDALQRKLRAGGVQVIDLKKGMREAALRDAENPVFFRLDSHWTNTGALVAAQSIRAGMLDNPTLKKALDATPAEGYQLTWATKKYRQNKIRDIANLLPTGTASFSPEESRRFTVTQENSARASLSGDTKGRELTLVGTSNSGEWLGFPDALRFALQRNIFNFPPTADASNWFFMRTYLQSDAFQINKPKLILWEMPIQSVGTSPSRFRTPRYQVSSAEWLLQVAALIETSCEPGSVRVKLDSTGIRSPAKSGTESSTQDTDYVEISFDQPVDASGYLSARLKTDGSRQVIIEAWDQAALIRKFVVDTAGDDRDHAFKTPLSLGIKGVTRLKIYPGQATAFSLKDINICRYQENWVKNLAVP